MFVAPAFAQESGSGRRNPKSASSTRPVECFRLSIHPPTRVAASVAGDHLRPVLPLPEQGRSAAHRRHPRGQKRSYRPGSRPGRTHEGRGGRRDCCLRAGSRRGEGQGEYHRSGPPATRPRRTPKSSASRPRRHSIPSSQKPRPALRSSRMPRCATSGRSPRRPPRPSCRNSSAQRPTRLPYPPRSRPRGG
jgi:hypothetical protein